MEDAFAVMTMIRLQLSVMSTNTVNDFDKKVKF